MVRKKYYFRTIITTLVIIMGFTGIHMYNHLMIQSIKFTDEWERGINIGTGGMNQPPLMSKYDDKIFTLTFNKEGKINYVLTQLDGKIIESNTADIKDFNKNKIHDDYLMENNYFYLKDSNLYQAIYEQGTGFKTAKLIATNIDGFNSKIIDEKITVQTFNKDKIEFYTMEDNGWKHEVFENSWEINNIYLNELNGEQYVFIDTKIDELTDEILMGNIKDIKENTLKKIDEINHLPSVYFDRMKIEASKNDFFIAQPSMRVGPGGSRTVYIDIKIIDSQKMSIKATNRIEDRSVAAISNLDKKIDLFKDEKGMKLIGSAINNENKYAMGADIFMASIKNDGEVSDVRFLSNTEHYSKAPSILYTNQGEYVTWLEVEVGGYTLMMNSTNVDFKANNMEYTKEDYKSAFMKALASPFYAIASTFIFGNIMLIYVVMAFIVVAYLIKRKNIESEKIKFGVFAIAYAILSLVTFKSIYYTGSGVQYMPDILNTWIAYGIVLLLNIVSGLMALAFYKDTRKLSYIAYLVFFVLSNVYLSNLLFVPFTMTKVILN